jgi:putative DNA methylase
MSWKAARGLAEDVRYYGQWVRIEAEKRIAHLFPKATTAEGENFSVVAWLWARTVPSPDPAFAGSSVPLVSSFVLSKTKGREAYVEPIITGASYSFDVRKGFASAGSSAGTGTKVGRGGNFKCLLSGSPISVEYIRDQGRAGRMSSRLMAVVAETSHGRVYLSPDASALPNVTAPEGLAEQPINFNPRDIRVQLYGLTRYRDLFTPRQLIALKTFSDLVMEVREVVATHAENALESTGAPHIRQEAAAYADAVATYLAFAVDRVADYGSTLATWRPKDNAMRSSLSKQAIAMTWDFAEGNPFEKSSAGFSESCEVVATSLEHLPATGSGECLQRDAASSLGTGTSVAVSTDPPYYDNIGYADLSDFFYIWLRRSLSRIYPDLFSTLLVPKNQELVAAPYRFEGDQSSADRFFEDGLRKTFCAALARHDARVPFTVFYAFKQEDGATDGDRASRGWEMMLQALVDAGFMIDGTWPMRTEGDNRQVGVGANVLASSILLVCRKRGGDTVATRRDLIGKLKIELPDALRKLQQSNIAAVDLAQAAIGPGMAVFSRYARVIEADGSAMRVRNALQLINQALGEVLFEQDAEYDADTQWTIAWFDEFGMSEGPFSEAETLSRAKNTSVGGLVESGLLRAAKGRVQLIARGQLDAGWEPVSDGRLTIWEVTQYLIARLKSGGEPAAADLLRKVGGMGEIARDLAYRLYFVCQRKGWTEEAIAYNSLAVAWPEITRLASEASLSREAEQISLD